MSNIRIKVAFVSFAFLVGLAGFAANCLAEEFDEAWAMAGADQIHKDLVKIDAAVQVYRKAQKDMPPNIEALVKSGAIGEAPVLPAELGGGSYEVSAGYDDLDGKGDQDHGIYTTMPVPAVVCTQFNKLHAGVPLNDGTIFDYQANGNKYPGHLYGRTIYTFAIKWESAQQGCEIVRVIEYR